MAKREDIEALEALTPWLREDFRADLAVLTESVAVAARAYAADARVLARLAAQVPRCGDDERGATPWTSFRREVAVARRTSDIAATADLRAAVRLTTVLPCTMALLEAGRLPVQRAKAFLTEVDCLDEALAARIDEQLAPRLVLLTPARIVQEVRKAAMHLDPAAAAARTAAKNTGRGVVLTPQADDQADVTIFGPAVPLTRWWATIDEQARALKQSGDPRSLDALRFDLAVGGYPCASHVPVDPTATTGAPSAAAGEAARAVLARAAAAGAGAAEHGGAGDPPDADRTPGPERTPVVDEGAVFQQAAEQAAAGLRASFTEPAPVDCRRSRPVQASIGVPVETSLGLSNDPAWLDGYGWISAPTVRTLLVDAELRRICTRQGTGELVDLGTGWLRPPSTPDALRDALLDFVLHPVTLHDTGWRTEPEHDPSDRLREFVVLRDRTCDGPTSQTRSASVCELDHDQAWPAGPTAAWNLVARATRTHQLKHYGWTGLRTPTATLWTSPAGQIVEVPHQSTAGTGIDDPQHARLPAPGLLTALDQVELTDLDSRQLPPCLPPLPRDCTQWSTLEGSATGVAPTDEPPTTGNDCPF